MKTRVILSLQQIAKKLVLVLVGAIMFLGLAQSAVQATPIPASQSTTQEISPEELAQRRAERRAEQSKASEAANTEVTEDKLNLEEIAEENAFTKGGNGVPESNQRNKAMSDRLEK